VSRRFLYFGFIGSLVATVIFTMLAVTHGIGHDVFVLGLSLALLFGAGVAFYAIELWPRIFQRETPSLESLLSRYPGPVLLKTPPIKFLVYTAGSAGLGGIIVPMLLDDPPSSIVGQALQWLGAFLCLGGALLLFATAFKGSSLRLSRDGFEIVSWRQTSIRWCDTSEFTTLTVSVTPPATIRRIVFNNAARAKKGEYNSVLFDTYDFATHDELAVLLCAWRAQALKITRSQNDDA